MRNVECFRGSPGIMAGVEVWQMVFLGRSSAADPPSTSSLLFSFLEKEEGTARTAMARKNRLRFKSLLMAGRAVLTCQHPQCLPR